jgi:hypothetical protein
LEKSDAAGGFKLLSFLAVSILTSHLILGTPYFLMEADAEQREYEIEKYDENITIPPDNIGYVTYNLEEGEEFEIVYIVIVKEDLPIDILFVNDDNYLLFINGTRFSFYIDGSEQEVVYTKKIISLKEPDVYVLVMTNSHNQTIEVNVVFELRTYQTETSEHSSWDTSIFFFPLLFAIIILVVLLVVLLLKNRKYKQAVTKVSKRAPPKKVKPKKRKVKEKKKKVSKKIVSKEEKAPKPKETEPKGSGKTSPGFCGYCGKPIDTPFCKYCGREV